MSLDPEVGRELKASELVPETVVVLAKPTSEWHQIIPYITVWVVAVRAESVTFWVGHLCTALIAKRTGPEREQLTGITDRPIQVFEYLGAV